MNIVESAVKDVTERMASARILEPLVAKHRSPPGALPWLSPHLDERRVKYGLADELFMLPAVYKRILVAQVNDFDGETYGPESLIVRTQQVQEREFQSTPRGVIVSAGLESMDVLYSHGMEVGDVVWVVQLGIYRLPYLRIGSKDMHVMVLQVGDIVAGVDTFNRIRSGQIELVREIDANGRAEHFYRRPGQPDCKPMAPFIPAEF